MLIQNFQVMILIELLSEKGFSSLDQLEFFEFFFNIDYYFSSPINEHLKRLIARQFNLIK